MRSTLIAGAMLVLAVPLALVGRPRSSSARLGRVVPRPAAGSTVRGAGTAGLDRPARPTPSARRRRVAVAVATGAALAVLVGGAPGVIAGLVAAAVTAWLLARQEPAATGRDRRRIEADLPYAADLLASALRAGARPESAAETVGTAIGGPLGDRLLRVGGALRLGAPSAEAWTCLGDSPAAVTLRRAAVRSEHSGAAFAEALRRQAEDLRAARFAAADAAGRRAAVLIVLPLGLCFLPAFVLAGLVPVIVAVLGDVLPP
jgi:pilus assembly protein TadC